MIVVIQTEEKLSEEYQKEIAQKQGGGIILKTGETLKIVSPRNTDSVRGLRIDVLVEHELLDSEVYWRIFAENPRIKRYMNLNNYLQNKEKQ